MPKNPVGAVVGLGLLALGIYVLVTQGGIGGAVPAIIGASLIYLGYRPGRVGLIVFGHACIVVGSILVTWGLYLLPYSKPVWQHIFFRPLFWGLISIFGGICANYHGFCNCVGARKRC
jgi:hypothetical protein